MYLFRQYLFILVVTNIVKFIYPFLSQYLGPRAWTWGSKKQDGRGQLEGATQEPPMVFFGVPFLGGLHGLLTRGVSYYETIRDQAKQSVYTTWLVSQKFYVVTEPELISKINRKQRIISSTGTFVETVYGKLLRLDLSSMALLRGRTNQGQVRESTTSLVGDSHHLYHTILKPGHSIMEQVLMDTLARFPAHFHSQNSAPVADGQPIELMRLIKHSVAMAMGDALYGRENPFALEPGLMDEFWNFEDGVFMLVMNILPSWTAPKAVRGRQRMVDALRRLYQKTGSRRPSKEQHVGTSGLVQEVRELHQKYGCSEDHIARAELGLLLGFTTSLVPALFWLVGKVAVWDDGQLLGAIRDELAPAVVVDCSTIGPVAHGAQETSSGNQVTSTTLSISALKAHCPLYLSTAREVLRFTAAGIAAFQVLEDTVLESTQQGRQRIHHLQKGAALQIPATAVHTDEAVWGPDAAEFVPGRFLAASGANKGKAHHSAFRAFGGGSTLCPGRHLAQDMMLAMAAMILVEFDLRFVGPVGLPEPDRKQLTSMMKPTAACPVVLEAREGSLGVASWVFEK